MKQHEVYLGLGGNMGDTLSILQSALNDIQSLGVIGLKVSHFYETIPMSDIPQGLFVNAACRFNTTMNSRELLSKLQEIELKHGKLAKPKNAPRVIDIDLLFFGNERCDDADCEIPHPRWRERPFVIKPLLDLTTEITVPGINPADTDEKVNLIELMQTFPNQDNNCKLIL